MPTKHFPSSKELLDAALAIYKEARDRNVRSALLGGFAMHLYGSDRLTKDVDFVADCALPEKKPTGSLTFGGVTYETEQDIDVDWIVRQDYQEALYAEALEHAVDATERPLRVVTPNYLAAIKFAARRTKDHDDLMRLLMIPDLVDGPKAKEIVERLLGGYAGEEFQAALDEAEWLKSR